MKTAMHRLMLLSTLQNGFSRTMSNQWLCQSPIHMRHVCPYAGTLGICPMHRHVREVKCGHMRAYTGTYVGILTGERQNPNQLIKGQAPPGGNDF